MLYQFLLLLSASAVLSAPFKQYTLHCSNGECSLRGHIEIKEANIIEEDIIMDDENDDDDEEGRNVVIDPKKIWPNKTVPYVFHEVFNSKQRKLVESAMRGIEAKTCVKFVPITSPEQATTSYLAIVDEKSGCSARVGYVAKNKYTIVNYNRASCLQILGTMQHELIHALGAKHEQSRPDRDLYIRLDETNIKPEHMNNFNKATAETFTTFNLPYNYESVMHYSAYAFTIDHSKPSIIIKDPSISPQLLGQREGLNALDVEMLRRLYQCDG